MPRLKRKSRSRRTRMIIVVAVAAVLLAIGSAYLLYESGRHEGLEGQQKPMILYVNQGNGFVNVSGFGPMLEVASSHGFNMVFFQAYRQGRLLYSPVALQSLVNQTHRAGLKIFFALYITNASQTLPTSIFGLGEDGVSLDMSTLTTDSQQAFLGTLKASFSGETAVTTTDMASPLKPDLLVLETYLSVDKQYIRAGIVGSVGVFATSSQSDYQSQFQYALQNSNGVMVFDYAGLKKAGY